MSPAQRRIIDARLDKAEKGQSYGPFDTAEKQRAVAKKTKRAP